MLFLGKCSTSITIAVECQLSISFLQNTILSGRFRKGSFSLFCLPKETFFLKVQTKINKICRSPILLLPKQMINISLSPWRHTKYKTRDWPDLRSCWEWIYDLNSWLGSYLMGLCSQMSCNKKILTPLVIICHTVFC